MILEFEIYMDLARWDGEWGRSRPVGRGGVTWMVWGVGRRCRRGVGSKASPRMQ